MEYKTLPVFLAFKHSQIMRQPTNARNSVASNTHRQPLVGKDSVVDTKTLAETERSQLHPSSLW